MAAFVCEVEAQKPKQHPVGITAEGGRQFNPVLFASTADWISPVNGLKREYCERKAIAFLSTYAPLA
jgi:hypothetical protein